MQTQCSKTELLEELLIPIIRNLTTGLHKNTAVMVGGGGEIEKISEDSCIVITDHMAEWIARMRLEQKT